MVDVLIMTTKLFVFLVLILVQFSLCVINFATAMCGEFAKKTRIKSGIISFVMLFTLTLTSVIAIGVE